MKIGLRIDVDTFRGTRFGVPRLCALLADQAIQATFFFSVGPDNMGRHLWRLLRPAFLGKMLRTRAGRLYGWDTLWRGTLWPGPVIGEHLGDVMRAAAQAGHEIGLHGWDHHQWQARLERMDQAAIQHALELGFEALTRILGHTPSCSAVPGWRCNDLVVGAKENFPFVYNSDCRGESIFQPRIGARVLSQPQIPVTLPTYDEAVGHAGITEANYNEYLLSQLRPEALNVLTVHAEVEGMIGLEMFRQFLGLARARGASFHPLGDLLKGQSAPWPISRLRPGEIAGREGWVACQETADVSAPGERR